MELIKLAIKYFLHYMSWFYKMGKTAFWVWTVDTKFESLAQPHLSKKG
jgi:hypothetical protein